MNNKHKHITSINGQENSKEDNMKWYIIPHNFTNVQTQKLKAVRLFRNKNVWLNHIFIINLACVRVVKTFIFKSPCAK